jgi:predicted kinase
MPTLYIFGGLPGTGKSSLSSRLACQRQAVYLRIDTIEQALKTAGAVVVGPKGYQVAYGLAVDNLRLGGDVVADSVNPLEITRAAWRAAAAGGKSSWVEIEIVCSDSNEHRSRVESRTSDIDGLQLPTWQAVVDRDYEAWTTDPIVIDTAGRSLDQSFAELLQALMHRGFGEKLDR